MLTVQLDSQGFATAWAKHLVHSPKVSEWRSCLRDILQSVTLPLHSPDLLNAENLYLSFPQTHTGSLQAYSTAHMWYRWSVDAVAVQRERIPEERKYTGKKKILLTLILPACFLQEMKEVWCNFCYLFILNEGIWWILIQGPDCCWAN